MKDANKNAKNKSTAPGATAKDQDLASFTTEDKTPLTTNHGQLIATDQNSLRAG